jgi:hypothetical protein
MTKEEKEFDALCRVRDTNQSASRVSSKMYENRTKYAYETRTVKKLKTHFFHHA